MVIAENKMQNNDFEGAQKIALRAKSLYPDLENIVQMLSICDVHCSAQRRLSPSEKDWYGVLQVEKLADEATVKKQYRRLALVLHPDKNRFPGAEGAFKLICEANSLLSDPAKKSAYDNKIRLLTRFASANPQNHNICSSQLNKQYSAQGIHISNSFSMNNQHQVPHSTFSVFWTCCPLCNNRYQCNRQFINRSLQCPRCKRVFVTYEMSAGGIFSGSKLGSQGPLFVPSKPDVRQPAVVTNQANSENKNAKVPSASQTGSRAAVNSKIAQPRVQKGSGSESIRVGSAFHGENAGVISNADVTRRELREDTQSKRQKRGGESFDAEQENLGDAATDLKFKVTRARFSHKSASRKNNESYEETDADDNIRPLKRARTNKEANRNEQKTAVFSEDSMYHSKSSLPKAPAPAPKFVNKGMGSAHSQESLKDKNEGCDKEVEMSGVTGVKSSSSAYAVEIASDSDLDLSSSEISEARCFDCIDPDFSDFDKLRDENIFCVGQFWTCHDEIYDGMPRYYAKVIKVSTSPFELQIKWLEAVPISNSYKRWVDEELHVGCGSFKLLGKLEKVSGSLSFSHQVHCEMGKKKGSHFIYPREGEVWAVFRDWDITWSSNPEDHKDFSYEVVEVLSNYAEGIGIEVCYLNKVIGFVSLFQKARETYSFVIGTAELYKFSHCVPSFKMTGTEREGVPIGSFELDPAALPSKPDDLYFPNKAKIDHRNTDPLVSSSQPKHAEGKGKSVVSGEMHTPHKIVDLEGSRAEGSILR